MKKFKLVLLLALLALGMGLYGCSGDDGNDGAAGAPGADGAAGAPGADGADGADGATILADVHTAGVGDLAVNNIVVTPTGDDLVITFNVTLNGAAKTDYTIIGRDYRLDGETMERRDLSDDGTAATLSGGTDGNYTLTIAGGNAYVDKNSRYLFRLENGDAARPAGYRVTVLADYPAAPVAGVLGNTSCADCHGSLGNGFHYGYPSFGGNTCVVCHDASNTSYPRLPELIHGIHQSANMPTGAFQPVEADGTPMTNRDGSPLEYKIAFPTYMNNCSICHTTAAALANVNAEVMSYEYCMSCHQSWDGFSHLPAAPGHTGFTAESNCGICHDGGTIPNTAAGFHNGLTTERAGLLWDGADASVTQGARVDHQITGVTRTGNDLAITWGATVDGVAVDPCNTTATENAPTFNSGYSVLKAFFQGDDLVNADNGASSPGQPNSTNLDFTAGTGNTVCSGNVATTTITLTDAEAALTGDARVALQGKPNLLFAPASAAAGTTIQVRAKSPVYDFNVATGAAATARRSITDSSLCLKCHVGSLYQHGGNRVDNVELCVMCHNEASSEQNVRVGMGVDASEAYDGQAGQTYGFKSMLHAIHASGRDDARTLLVYRNRGIYAFGPDESAIPNWPGTGSQIVYGSDNVTQPHNFVTAHYPRPLNDCSACHTADFSAIPDQTKAVATTIDAGAAPWDNQLDDSLRGPAAAACIGCHNKSDAAAQAKLVAHTSQMGWTATTSANGRADFLNYAAGAETCDYCHK